MGNYNFQEKKSTGILRNIKTGISLLLIFSIFAIPGKAQNFTVTSNGDTHATAPANASGGLDAGGQTTLRSAMEAATAIAGTHIITIPGSITQINLTLGQMTVGSAALGNNITVNGPGKAVLTINQTTVARIFVTGTGAVTFNINDLTMNYTGPVGTILSGGGGCVQAGGTNANTTMTNVAINNFNIQVGNGGAFLSSAANVNGVTLTNCDFNNNFCGGGGGAVSIQTTSTATITNCKFINNSTGNISGSAGNNTGGSGGALSVTGAGGTHNVTNCTFVNNHQTTASQGGAIMLSNGTLNVSFCRFIGNSANIPTNGNTLAVAGGNSQVINAENNWWGANSGPAGNDAVVLAAGATINLTKWLQLKTSISTNPLCTGASATVTASFLSNSASEAVTTGNISTLIGQPISFVNPTLGSLSGGQSTIQNNGTATVLFTAGGTAGTGSVNAVVDNIPNNDVAPAKVSVTINPGAAVTGNPSNTAVCAGANASFTASFSGTPTPTIQWQVSTNGGGIYNNIAGATSSPLTFATVAGDNGKLYRAVGTNTCGSATTTGALLTVNTAPTVAGNPSNTSVPSGSNASFTASFSGSPTPTLQWQVSTNGGGTYNNIAGATSSPLIFTTNLSQSGNLYRCVGTNLCSSINTTGALLTVTSACAVTGSGTTTAPTCFGGNNGTASITLTGAGSGAPGTYTVDGGSSQAYGTNPFTVTGLTSGSHTIVATVTSGGCVSSNIVVSVGTTAALTGSGTTTPITCFGNTNGTATITLSASTSGTYTVDGGGSQSYNTNPFTVTGLSAGNHTIVATSAAGCVSDLIGVSVGSVAQLTGSGTTTPTTCGNGANATAAITLSASTSGTYTVDGGSSQSYATNPFTITGLSAGNHTIVATSAAGCVSSNILVNVGGSSTFTATYVKTNLSQCSGTPNGTITVTATGGTAPYTYAWTGVTGSGNPATTQYPNPGNVSAVTGLNYGFYNVTITDAGGCAVVTLSNIHIEIGYQVTITNSGSVSSSCGNTGSLIFYGNAGLAPYTWSLTSSAGPFQSGNTFTGLAAGPYTVWVKDNGGCITSKSVTVNSAPAIVVSPFVRNASNCSADGSIQIFRSGGIPPYTYSITSAAGPFQVSNNFTGLAAGPYTAYVKDAAGCIGQQDLSVAQGAALTVSVSKVNTSTCVNDGSIQVNPSGGQAPYSYSIDGGTTYQASNSFTGLGAGNYTITVKDFKNCTGETNVNISLNPIVVTASATAAGNCATANGSIQLFRTGGYAPYTYSINGNTYQNSNTFSNVAAGTYTGFVKDLKGCIGVLNGIAVGPICPPTFAGNINPSSRGNHVKVSEKTVLNVQAYPNPSQADFTLILQGYDSKEKVSIIVTDLLGRKVYQAEGVGKQQYRFGNDFMTGMYNVQVISGTEKKNIKVVKEN